MTTTDAPDLPKVRYKPADQHLADALQGTAPALSRHLASKLPPAKVLELAAAIDRAVELGARRRGEELAAIHLEETARLQAERIRQVHTARQVVQS